MDGEPNLPPKRRFNPWTLLIGAALFAILAGLLRWQENSIRQASLSDAPLAGAGVRVEAGVLKAVRAAKLVTIELQTTVTAQSSSESWRGDVAATVRAPVRILFGTDLSNLADNALSADPFGRSLVVTVPPPTRLATEVLGEGEKVEVTTGWLRLRSMAGEYHLGVARRGLYEAARNMTVKPDDARQIEDATRQQVAQLVRAVAGERVSVEVRFAEARP